MERSSKNKFIFLIQAFLFGIVLNGNLFCQTDQLEKNISKALSKDIHCKNVTVKVKLDNTNSKKITNLIIKLDEVVLDKIKADYITILLKNPVIDNTSLNKRGKFKLISAGDKKVNILLSVNTLQQYLSVKAEEFGKKNVNIKLKFSPPYIECFYDVPKKEIASETLGILSKFIPGDKLEGYAAFTLTVNKNELSAHSSKVILNHFLLPNTILNIFENRFNPFDKIIPIGIVDYKINKLNVQAKYILLSN